MLDALKPGLVDGHAIRAAAHVGRAADAREPGVVEESYTLAGELRRQWLQRQWLRRQRRRLQPRRTSIYRKECAGVERLATIIEHRAIADAAVHPGAGAAQDAAADYSGAGTARDAAVIHFGAGAARDAAAGNSGASATRDAPAVSYGAGTAGDAAAGAATFSAATAGSDAAADAAEHSCCVAAQVSGAAESTANILSGGGRREDLPFCRRRCCRCRPGRL